MANVTFQIEVPITPKWPHIELLRSSVLNCLATIFQDNEYCHSVGMITSELLENAVKYGSWESDPKSFKLRVAGDPSAVEVEVSNPIDRTSPELDELMRTVRFLDGYENAEEAYLMKLRQVAERVDGTSRLGLSRIAYEGRCRIFADVEDSVLRVRAVSRP